MIHGEVLDDTGWADVAKVTIPVGETLNGIKQPTVRRVFICLRGTGLSIVKNWPKTLFCGARRALKSGVAIEVPGEAEFELVNNGEQDLVLAEIIIYMG